MRDLQSFLNIILHFRKLNNNNNWTVTLFYFMKSLCSDRLIEVWNLWTKYRFLHLDALPGVLYLIAEKLFCCGDISAMEFICLKKTLLCCFLSTSEIITQPLNTGDLLHLAAMCAHAVRLAPCLTYNVACFGPCFSPSPYFCLLPP